MTTHTLQEKMYIGFVYLFVIGFAAVCLLPFWLVLINSFATEDSIRGNGFSLIPSAFSLYSYEFLFSGNQVFRSYSVSLIVTSLGTLMAVFITMTYSFVLAHPRVKYRNVFAFLTYFTMIFGAGLVGFYMLVAIWLGLKDSIWAMILPYLLNPFFAFVLVAFYRTLPYELQEAATVDGANDLTIFFRIIFPISMPAVATISLFYALQYWNDWWLALLFVDDNKLHPLQIMIRQLISNIDAQKYIAGSGMSYQTAVPTYGIQFASICVTIGPLVLLYPFLQRYFVKGLTLGAVKG